LSSPSLIEGPLHTSTRLQSSQINQVYLPHNTTSINSQHVCLKIRQAQALPRHLHLGSPSSKAPLSLTQPPLPSRHVHASTLANLSITNLPNSTQHAPQPTRLQHHPAPKLLIRQQLLFFKEHLEERKPTALGCELKGTSQPKEMPVQRRADSTSHYADRCQRL